MHRCWCPGINLLVIHGHPLCSCPGSSPGVSLDLAVETNGDLKLPSQFSLVQPLSRVQLFATPWTAACQASLSITNSCSWSQWCHPTISSSVVPFSSCLQSFPASRSFQMSQFFPSGVQSIEISASASVLPMNIEDFRISFRMDWLDLLVVQGTLKSLLQHHSSKTSILWCSAFFMVQLSHPYMTTGKTIALTRWTFVGNVCAF